MSMATPSRRACPSRPQGRRVRRDDPPEVRLRTGGRRSHLQARHAGHVADTSSTGRSTAFAVPLDRWFRGPLAEFSRDLLLSQRSRERGILSRRTSRRCSSDTGAGVPSTFNSGPDRVRAVVPHVLDTRRPRRACPGRRDVPASSSERNREGTGACTRNRDEERRDAPCDRVHGGSAGAVNHVFFRRLRPGPASGARGDRRDEYERPRKASSARRPGGPAGRPGLARVQSSGRSSTGWSAASRSALRPGHGGARLDESYEALELATEYGLSVRDIHHDGASS